MPYTMEKLPDAPIVLFTILPNSDVGREMVGNITAIGSMLDEQTEPIFLVYDLIDMKLGLDDLMQATSMATRGANAILHHPNLRENVFVVTDSMLKLAISGLTSATFGHVRLSRFDSIEQALAYCKQHIGVSDESKT